MGYNGLPGELNENFYIDFVWLKYYLSNALIDAFSLQPSTYALAFFFHC
jgi:hypothetical protein